MGIAKRGGHRLKAIYLNLSELQGGHKPGKLRELKKLSKSQGKLREMRSFVEETWKTQGK